MVCLTQTNDPNCVHLVLYDQPSFKRIILRLGPGILIKMPYQNTMQLFIQIILMIDIRKVKTYLESI